MSSTDKAPAADVPPARWPWVAVVLLAFTAALVLWVKFGPSAFVDALTAAWTCL